jgi:hypothetical protein
VAGWADRRDAFHTVWQGRAAGWPAALLLLSLALAVGLGASGLTAAAGISVLTVSAAALLGIGGLLLVAEAAAAGLVEVHISAYSVRVRPGLLPVTGTAVPVRSIRSAEVVMARRRPREGWGWWWRSQPGRAVLVRSGPAVRLGLASGRSLVISVDQPQQAVAALRQVAAV